MNSGTYFLTFVVYKKQRILDALNIWGILAESLQYRIDKRQIAIEGLVFMIDHIHLIVTSNDMIKFVREYKRSTTKSIKNHIRSEYHQIVPRLTNKFGKFQFWHSTNMPIWVESDWFFQQKLNYIHENPVLKSYVADPEDWYWSSANIKCPIKIDRSNW